MLPKIHFQPFPVVRLLKMTGTINELDKIMPKTRNPNSIRRLAAWWSCGRGPSRKFLPLTLGKTKRFQEKSTKSHAHIHDHNNIHILVINRKSIGHSPKNRRKNATPQRTHSGRFKAVIPCPFASEQTRLIDFVKKYLFGSGNWSQSDWCARVKNKELFKVNCNLAHICLGVNYS